MPEAVLLELWKCTLKYYTPEAILLELWGWISEICSLFLVLIAFFFFLLYLSCMIF